jgi:hypothetical protein
VFDVSERRMYEKVFRASPKLKIPPTYGGYVCRNVRTAALSLPPLMLVFLHRTASKNHGSARSVRIKSETAPTFERRGRRDADKTGPPVPPFSVGPAPSGSDWCTPVPTRPPDCRWSFRDTGTAITTSRQSTIPVSSELACSKIASARLCARASAVIRISGWVPLARSRNQPSPRSTRTPSSVETSS